MTRKTIWKTSIGLSVLLGTLYYCVQSNVRLFCVITGSMEPLIPAGSLVVSKSINFDNVKKGKVIVFNNQDNRRVTTHRVVEIQDGQYVTKGDANSYNDRYLVTPADVMGEVMGVFPTTDPMSTTIQLAFLFLVLGLGILLNRFLLCLKHGASCSTPASNAFYRLCFFRRPKKVACGGQAPLGPG